MKLCIQTVEEFKNTTFNYFLKNFNLNGFDLEGMTGYVRNHKRFVKKVENILKNFNVKFVGLADYHTTKDTGIQFVFMNENKEVINYI